MAIIGESTLITPIGVHYVDFIVLKVPFLYVDFIVLKVPLPIRYEGNPLPSGDHKGTDHHGDYW